MLDLAIAPFPRNMNKTETKISEIIAPDGIPNNKSIVGRKRQRQKFESSKIVNYFTIKP